MQRLRKRSRIFRWQVPIWLLLVVLVVTASVGSGLVLFSGLLGDFQIQSDSPSQRLIVGGPDVFFPIHVRSTNGFRGIVTMTATASPGASAFLRGSSGPNPAVTLGINDTVFLTVKVTTLGNYTVSVTGTSGILSHTINVLVLAQGLDLSATQNPLMVARNSSGNTTLTIRSLNGLSGTLQVVCYGYCTGGGNTCCLDNLTLFLPTQNKICPLNSTGCLIPLSRGGTVPMILTAAESRYTQINGGNLELEITVDWATGLGYLLTYTVIISFS